MAFKGLRFARAEVRNTTANMPIKVAMVAISVIPLLYGALYLLAFLDPYEQLNTVPVAVVNEDEGAQIGGSFRVAGDDVVERLRENDDGLGWEFVSAEQARSGLEDGSYYMTCTIPAGFSATIASAEGDVPKQAELVIEYNEAKNMLASQIGATVWKEVRQQVSDSVSQEYWENVFGRVNDGAAQLQDAVEGATELADGLDSAYSGSKEISTNLNTLEEGTNSLASGLETLEGGAASLQSGTGSLVDGTSSLASGASTLASGTTSLDGGAAELASGSQRLASGASQLKNQGTSVLSAGTSQLRESTAKLPDQATVATAQSASEQIGAGIASLSAGLEQLKGNASNGTGLAGAAAGAHLLSSQLADTSAINAGVEQLHGGLAQVQEGRVAAASGLDQIQQALAGAQQQVDGAAGVLGSIDTSGLDPETATKIGQAYALLDASQGGASATIASASGGAAQVGAGLADGGSLDVGLQQIDAGITQLGDSANEGLQSASVAASQIATGLDTAIASIGSSSTSGTLLGGAAALSAGYQSFSGQVLPLVEQAPALRSAIEEIDDGAAAVDKSMASVASGAAALDQGAVQVRNATMRVASGAAQLASGAGALLSGAVQLDDGAIQLADGASSALDGAVQLQDGAGKLADGSEALTDGLQSALDGSSQLANGLAEGADGMAVSNTQRKASVFSSPVQLEEEYFTTVKNYGTGFAPYFIALGLWVGALMGSFVFKPLNERVILSGGNPAMAAFANYIPLALVSMAQVLLLLVVLQFGLNLQIDNIALYYAFGIFTALVFAAIMQMLMAAFGFPGKFIAIILLMLQLTSAAGTFPIEQTPAFFQAISPFLPMTYVVSGMRQVMTGIDMSTVASSLAVLAAFGAASFLATSLVAWSKRMVRMEDLHPLLQLG